MSALLSGVMIKTGVYGILRLPGFLPPLGVGHGLLLGAIGLGSAVIAITLTLGQDDIKKALAYSSVENVGLILLGVGLAVAGGASGHPVVAALGLGGALFHVWTHALMKALAFLGAGTLVHAVHSQDLGEDGGPARARLPFTGAFFLVGAASLAALPPLSGFASEWLLYLGLLRSGATAASGATALIAYLAVAVLALVGAIAAISFTRIAGVALLGAPRSPEAARAHEVAPASWVPLALLASGCVLFGLLPGLPLRMVTPVAVQLGAVDKRGARAGGGPGVGAEGRHPRPRLDRGRAVRIAAPAGKRRRRCRDLGLRLRGSHRAHGVHRLLLLPALRRGRRATRLAPSHPRAVAPRGVPGKGTFRTDAQDPARTWLFDPLFRLLGDRMSRLRRFQAGRLNLQLLYTLLTLIALLALLAFRGRFP